MKRLREVETRAVAQEMVALANTMDSTQAMLLIFGSVDPLLEILKHRPILVINLMLTNKTLLALFSERIPLIWRVLLDQLITAEQGEYAASIYPFFIYEHDAFFQRYRKLAEAFDWPGEIRERILRAPANITSKEWKLWNNTYGWRVKVEDAPVTVLYAESVLSQHQDMMNCLDYLEYLLKPVIYFSSDDYTVEVYDWEKKIEVEWLGDAVRVTHNPKSFTGGEILLHVFTQTLVQVEDLTKDLDGFVYHDDPDHADIILLHYTDPERYHENYTADKDNAFPRIVGLVLTYLKQLAASLLLRLRPLCELPPEELVELYPPLVLTATSVMPYRQVVFQVLYPTPEDHRLLLLRILRELSAMRGKAGTIADYGHCIRCGRVVDQVSLASLLPHCGDPLCKQLS